MSLHRRAAKRDENEQAIVAALMSIGVTVYRISGRGVPDLLTYYRGVWLPMEVKMPKGRTTAAQDATSRVTPYQTARTVAEALLVFGVDFKRHP